MDQVAAIKAPDAIAAGNAKFMEAFSRGDAAGVAQLYSEDGAVLPPNADILRGRAAIQAFWQGAMDMGVKAVALTTIEVEDQGPAAVEVGQYALRGEAGQVLDKGKYVVFYKRMEGEWKLHRDIWNSSVPAPA